jgi:hypothetical protein
MANPETIERAFFQIEGSTEKVEVHFNPESLQFTITNNLENQGSGNSTKQYVSDSTGKLTMDLIFDNTGIGEDVRLKTVKIAKFMEPSGSGNEKTPPIVNFEWGLYKFKGMVDTYKETIDYFSANGVPLRASVNISMSSQDAVFEGGSGDKNAGTSDSAGRPNSAVPANPVTSKGLTDLATKAGDPAAAKGIASSNGVENMRFPGDASMEIDGSVALKGPAGFASAGIGLNAGAGLDIGIGGGLDLGIGGGLDISAGVLVGSSLSAGVSASAGAFAGLQTSSAGSTSATLKLDNFINSDMSGSLGIDAGSVGLGGGAGLQGSASLKAEVGQAGELKSKIEFDGG